jgi:hypothetical protein
MISRAFSVALLSVVMTFGHLGLLVFDLACLAFCILHDCAEAIAVMLGEVKGVKSKSPLDTFLCWVMNSAATHWRFTNSMKNIYWPG